MAIHSIKNAVIKAGLDYETDEGGGAFYGPKIDIKLTDNQGKQWQCSTIQFDFNLPGKFNMAYIGADGEKHTPVMVHRALFGSLERFFAMLIEHYDGAFPIWLAPIQIGIVPVSDCHKDYASKVLEQLKIAGLRARLDSDDEKMKAKIFKMEQEKIPVIFVIGDKEVNNNQIAVRSRKLGNLGMMTLEDFFAKIKTDLEMGTPKYIGN